MGDAKHDIAVLQFVFYRCVVDFPVGVAGADTQVPSGCSTIVQNQGRIDVFLTAGYTVQLILQAPFVVEVVAETTTENRVIYDGLGLGFGDDVFGRGISKKLANSQVGVGILQAAAQLQCPLFRVDKRV